MDLPEGIEVELSRARLAEKEGNDGKARVCARRAVGKASAISGYQGQPAPALSTTQVLNIISSDGTLAEGVREAAERLAASVAQDHGLSVSDHPVEDALVIISGLFEKQAG